jgi:demethylmenaquinone methyltransferase/2-methoxy-6-polyprenyl-1,4-benzoquinol methylase
MLKTAGLHLAGLPEQQCSASLVRADVRHLAFPNEYFDAIYTGFTLELFSDPEITLVLNECRRVLRGSGRLCVLHMANPSHGGIMSRAYRWTHARFPGWVDCRPIDLSGPLRAAGFHQQEVRHASLWGLPVDLCLAT